MVAVECAIRTSSRRSQGRKMTKMSGWTRTFKKGARWRSALREASIAQGWKNNYSWSCIYVESKKDVGETGNWNGGYEVYDQWTARRKNGWLLKSTEKAVAVQSTGFDVDE